MDNNLPRVGKKRVKVKDQAFWGDDLLLIPDCGTKRNHDTSRRNKEETGPDRFFIYLLSFWFGAIDVYSTPPKKIKHGPVPISKNMMRIASLHGQKFEVRTPFFQFSVV